MGSIASFSMRRPNKLYLSHLYLETRSDKMKYSILNYLITIYANELRQIKAYVSPRQGASHNESAEPIAIWTNMFYACQATDWVDRYFNLNLSLRDKVN